MNTTTAQQQPDRRRAGPSLARGLGASLLFGLIGAAIPIAVLAAMMVGRWMIFGASEVDRHDDLARFMIDYPSPAIGIACIFAAAAWATYAPSPPQQFAQTFAIIALISIVSWPAVILLANGFEPRLKGAPAPSLISIASLLVSPPALVAFWLTIWRNTSGRRDELQGQDASSIRPSHPANTP